MSESTGAPVSANIAGLKIAGKLEDEATVLYYETTLWRKLALHDDEKALQPRYWLPTPLFQRFRNRLKFHVNDPFGMTPMFTVAQDGAARPQPLWLPCSCTCRRPRRVPLVHTSMLDPPCASAFELH